MSKFSFQIQFFIHFLVLVSSLDEDKVVNLSLAEKEKVEKLLSSKCYFTQPDVSKKATKWGYDYGALEKIVEGKVIGDKELCSKLSLCPKLLPWMIEKKGSGDGGEGESKKKSFPEIQAKTYKEVPTPSAKEPLKVYISFFIESISGFSEVDQEFGVGTFVRYDWNVTLEKCRRYLRAMGHLGVQAISVGEFEDEKTGEDLPGDLSYGFFVKLESENYKMFWMPDVFMENAKSVSRQLSTFDTNYLDVSGFRSDDQPTTCGFTYIERFAATVPCDMNFLYYPIDAQDCFLRFRSFENTNKEVLLLINSARLSDDVKKGLGDQYANLSENVAIENLFGKEYSVITLQLRIQRTITPVLVGTIVPSILIVAISFSSFWLGLDYLGDRINVGMICLLAVLAQFAQIRGNLPPAAYVTFMDYWIILCIFSIVGQLLQTTLVYFVYNYQQMQVIKKKEEELKKDEREKTFFSRTIFESKNVRVKTSRSYVGEQLRRRRMSQPVDHFEDGNSNDRSPKSPSTVTGEEQSSFVRNVIKFEKMLFEPPVKKTSTRYIPMKIDSVTRVLFPFTFITCTIVYWIILLSQRDLKYHVF